MSGVVFNAQSVGSTGMDYSVNRPTIPAVGQPFTGAPWDQYVLLVAVPANADRANVSISNASGNAILVIRDDGAAVAGHAPVNASIIPLAAGQVNGQGGYWSSTTFKGRVQVYGPAGSFVSVFVD